MGCEALCRVLEQERLEVVEEAVCNDGSLPLNVERDALGADDLAVEAEADVSGPSAPPWILTRELSEVEGLRLEVVQQLLRESDGTTMRQRQQSAAEKLGISVRSVQRLVSRWKQDGLEGLLRLDRRDRGAYRVDEEWQKFILKTYRQGNREGRRMTQAQVAVRVKARAAELGDQKYPSHMTVYRILAPEIEKRSRQVRSIGWRGDRLSITTRDGVCINIEYSNQVWQSDHTSIDVLVVDSSGEVLGRPWLTTIVDSYSRCVVGYYLGMERPSSDTVCLALRHGILPKRYPSTYKLSKEWGTYGLPKYLYTDSGAEFRSKHIEAVGASLKIDAYLRRKPSDGGLIERPFGTFNTELWSTLPGYTGSNVPQRPEEAQANACLTLPQLEMLLVRYLVDRYNQGLDARMGDQTRIGRWEAGRIAQLPLLGERELDVCLMRRDRRTVYRGGYIQFAGLVYRGEYLGGYAGEWIVVRYTPRDITTVLVYRTEGGKEVFLTRAHATELETEELSLSEARAISRRLRAAGREMTNRSVLLEVRARDAEVASIKKASSKSNRGQKHSQEKPTPRLAKEVPPPTDLVLGAEAPTELPSSQDTSVAEMAIPSEASALERRRSIGEMNVYDYEQARQEYGW
jgi:putative transposase